MHCKVYKSERGVWYIAVKHFSSSSSEKNINTDIYIHYIFSGTNRKKRPSPLYVSVGGLQSVQVIKWVSSTPKPHISTAYHSKWCWHVFLNLLWCQQTKSTPPAGGNLDSQLSLERTQNIADGTQLSYKPDGEGVEMERVRRGEGGWGSKGDGEGVRRGRGVECEERRDRSPEVSCQMSHPSFKSLAQPGAL